jgi:hypothetical protein
MLHTSDPARIEILVGTPAADTNGEISPKGRWLGYQSAETGMMEIYVRPFPNVNDARWPISKSLTYAAMDVATAIKAYAEERRAQVSKRMVAYWLENLRPLSEFFKDAKLRQIAPAQIADYQNARTDAGRAPKTINGEVSVLRQVLKRAKLWYRFADEYKALRNRKPPVGRVNGRGAGTAVCHGANEARVGCTPTLRARWRSIAVCARARRRRYAGKTSIGQDPCCT